MPPTPLARRIGTPAYAMLGGGLLALAMPPLGLFPLAWIALVPLLVRWKGLRNAWTIFREAYVAFLLMAVGAGFWLLFHQSTVAALASGLALLLLPLPHALAFVGSAFVRLRFGLTAGLLALVCNVLAAEYLLALIPGGIPWLALGHTQATATPFNQLAELGGVGLLTVFVLVTNGLGLAVVSAQLKPGLLPGFRTLLTLVFLILLSGTAEYGENRIATLDPSGRTLQVSVIQPAEPAGEWADATDWERVERLTALTESTSRTIIGRSFREVIENVDNDVPASLIVWPEAALPVFDEADVRERLYSRLGQWSLRREADLLTGATVQESPDGPVTSAALLFRGTTAPEMYARVRPSPLALRLPFLNTTPLLDAMGLDATRGRFVAGDAPVLFQVDGAQLAPIVGHESLHGDYVRDVVGRGADAVVVLSASGWWAQSMGAKQHLALTRLRAIETRRSVLLAAANGTSALISPDGSVDLIAGWQETKVADVTVPLAATSTPYTQHGDVLGRFASYGAVGLLLVLGLSLAFSRKPAPPKKPRQNGTPKPRR